MGIPGGTWWNSGLRLIWRRRFFPAYYTRLIVPSITIYEVFKSLFRGRSEGEALAGIAAMRQGRVVDLDGTLALSAARISTESRLPMAGSIVLATARAHGAVLWTQDADFQGLPDVRFKAK